MSELTTELHLAPGLTHTHTCIYNIHTNHLLQRVYNAQHVHKTAILQLTHNNAHTQHAQHVHKTAILQLIRNNAHTHTQHVHKTAILQLTRNNAHTHDTRNTCTKQQSYN